jgi:adenylate cyclase
MISKLITTFVFSDIEHSTRLAQQLHEDYPELLERHRSVIRAGIEKYGGKEIDTAGDGFFMTFEKPQCAILAALEAQQAFYNEDWAKEINLKVRMGIHTGMALPTAGGYTGVEVHLASRICSAAYGGQVLVSKATQKYLPADYTDQIHLTSLGAFNLKDFPNPLELFQLAIPGVKLDFKGPRIVPDEKRIAVLPFIHKSKRAELEYIGEGMAEEIIITLGKIAGLRVVSRSASFALKDQGLDVVQIGQKLNVSSVLEGRIRKIGDHMIIRVELIDAQTGLNIWSGKYSSAGQDLLQIIEEISQEVGEALNYKMDDQQLESTHQRQTHNAEAYDYYLRGRRFYLQFSNRGMDLALIMFEKAIEADERYALAYAGMADCYSYQFQHKIRSQAIIEKAEVASKKGIELAPNLAEAHASRGIVLSLQGKFAEAEESFGYAIERDPTLYLGWFHYGRACFTAGKMDKAARLFEQANRVEPEDYQSILLAAQSYADIGSKELARRLRRRGVEIAEKRLELNPGDTRALYMAANTLVFLNRPDKSFALIQRALALEPDDSMLLYNAACVYALLGMTEEALNCVEKAYEAGLTLRGWYENDSNLNSIREEPRFKAVMEKMIP